MNQDQGRDLIRASEALAITGLSRSAFWALVHRELSRPRPEWRKEPPVYKYPPRNYRFRRTWIEQLRDRFAVTSSEDLRRLADGRRR